MQEMRYRAGATTILDLLDAQVSLTEAEADLVQARYVDPAVAGRPRGDPRPPTLLEQGRPVRRDPVAVRCVLVLAGGCGKRRWRARRATPAARPVEAGRPRRRRCRSRSSSPRADTVVDAILATGQIEAMQSIELRPDIEGRIVEILVREGADGRPRARRSSRWTTPSSRRRSPGPRPSATWRGSRSPGPATCWRRRPPASRSWSGPRPLRAAPRRSSSCSRSGSTAPRARAVRGCGRPAHW